ncbi:50S ribosomal protein L25/general stress protein Ctc [Pseudanabaena sp. PCC 6802]|uniref:50S ribosomal protein L25/general stress protein Ctc n=1 Tax=Pseudanabaena sp. PCC 6802 TaxID=118173 RepID=UPI00034AAE92|nr:50S ribosomal protein L25/general stress protein Ctc [Pseudanabaena sp. PCC 6802]
MKLSIAGTTRTPNTNPRALRRSGRIPATVYGHKGAESTAISLDGKETIALLRQAKVNNTMIDLSVSDGDFKGVAILREVQMHPYKNDIYHLSFFAIGSQSSVEVDIPLHFTGVPVGVKVGGGSVEVLMNQIKVSCPPNSIPESLEVDITNLNVGKGIHVGDIALPEGVTLVGDATPLVVNIMAGRNKG